MFDVILPHGQSVRVDVEPDRTADEIAKVIAGKASLPVPPSYRAELYVVNTGQALLMNTADEISHEFAKGAKIGLRIVSFSPLRELKSVAHDASEDQHKSVKKSCKVMGTENISKSKPNNWCKKQPSVASVTILCTAAFAIPIIFPGLIFTFLSLRFGGISMFIYTKFAISGIVVAIILGIGLKHLLTGLKGKQIILALLWGISWPLLFKIYLMFDLYVYIPDTYFSFNSILFLGTGFVLALIFKRTYKEYRCKHFLFTIIGWLGSGTVLSILLLLFHRHFGMYKAFIPQVFINSLFWALIFALCGAVGGFITGITLKSALREVPCS